VARSTKPEQTKLAIWVLPPTSPLILDLHHKPVQKPCRLRLKRVHLPGDGASSGQGSRYERPCQIRNSQGNQLPVRTDGILELRRVLFRGYDTVQEPNNGCQSSSHPLVPNHQPKGGKTDIAVDVVCVKYFLFSALSGKARNERPVFTDTGPRMSTPFSLQPNFSQRTVNSTNRSAARVQIIWGERPETHRSRQ